MAGKQKSKRVQAQDPKDTLNEKLRHEKAIAGKDIKAPVLLTEQVDANVPAGPTKKHGAVARVWEIAASMKDDMPKEVIAACVEQGINLATAKTQYGQWHKATFKQTPSERWGTARRSPSGNGVSAVSDEGVKTITDTRTADGWTSRMMFVNKVPVPVFKSPEGVEYVQAHGNEKADLIVDHRLSRHKGLGVTRCRLLATSSHAKKANEQASLEAQGEAAMERKAAKRVSRKKVGAPS